MKRKLYLPRGSAAKAIADQLQEKISGPEERVIASRPTGMPQHALAQIRLEGNRSRRDGTEVLARREARRLFSALARA